MYEEYETEWHAYVVAKYANNNSAFTKEFENTCELEYERTSEIYRPTTAIERRQKYKNRYHFRIRWGRVIAVALIIIAIIFICNYNHGWLHNLFNQPSTVQAAGLVNNGLDSYSKQGIMLDSNGNIMWSKNADEKIYPASLTKIMTAVVALENLPDLGQTTNISDTYFPSLYIEHASQAGFQPGDEVSVKDLLYGTMLPSGAECSLALADLVAGNEEAFVLLMNKKAQQLDMLNTHFTNCTGLHQRQHCTTAADLSHLLQYALQNKTFRTIFTTETYTATTGLTMQSILSQRLSSNSFSGGMILGSKTGYTEEAGYNLATLAEKNNQEYILITCGADDEIQPQEDAIDLFSAIK